ncbi:MAG: site-specific integrase, partial [Rhodospirillales bacterium]
MNLTHKSINGFKYRGGWDVRWDDKVTGLGLRVYASGKKSFVLSYRFNGEKKLMTLGAYGVLTVDKARTYAQKALVQVKEDIDPKEVKGRASKGETFEDLSKSYIDRYAKVHKKTWAEDKRRLEKHIPPSWSRKRLANFKQTDIAALYTKIGETRPYEANRVLSLLRTMFSLAPELGHMEKGAANPADISSKARYKEVARDRWLMPEEFPKLVTAIDTEPNLYARSAIWLLALTGLRKNELLMAKWEQVNWERGTLRLPDTKSGKAQNAPLNAPALAIMQAIPRISKNPYILPGGRKGQPMTNLNVPWNRICKKAGIEGLRLHDLRRTTGSWMTRAGVDLNLI